MDEIKTATDPNLITENMMIMQDLKATEKSLLNLVVKRPG